MRGTNLQEPWGLEIIPNAFHSSLVLLPELMLIITLIAIKISFSSTPFSLLTAPVESLNVTYTYSQSAHRFSGTAYDGSWIDTTVTGCCCGQSGSCCNNPSCQCQASVGPLPQGTDTLGNMRDFKGMKYC
jgi:hypothetical protein